MKLYEMEKSGTNGFNFVFEKDLEPREEVIVKMPSVSANKRGINDIGWASDGYISLYGTIEKDARKAVLWQEIEEHHEINKVTSALKIVNNDGKKCKVVIRAIFN